MLGFCASRRRRAVVERVGGRRDAARWIKGLKGTARRINCSEAQYYRLGARSVPHGASGQRPLCAVWWLIEWGLAFLGLAHRAPLPSPSKVGPAFKLQILGL